MVYCGNPDTANCAGIQQVAATVLSGVRCCADRASGDGWIDKCDDKTQTPGVVGRSSVGGRCHKQATFAEAAGVCGDAGGRLCSPAELGNSCVAKTGCKLDRKQVWGCAAAGACGKDAECCSGNCANGSCV